MKQIDFPKEHVNFLFDYGGVGDLIAAMPVFNYIHNIPQIIPIVWVPDFFLDFAKNLLPHINFQPFSKGQKKYNQSHASRKFSNVYTNLRSHMTEHAFRVLINQDAPTNNDKNYVKLNLDKISLKHIKLPESYVVVTTGFTAPIREWVPSSINATVDHIKSKGYEVVFLGKKQAHNGDVYVIEGTFKEEVDYSKGLNLIDKTSLLQAGKIIGQAKCVVGLDNGLLHVAGCTDVPIVGGFTSVDPVHRMPYRNGVMGHNYYPVVPPLDEPERFFQSRYDFIFHHDYKFSYLKNDSLVNSMVPELWIEQLEKVL